MVSRPRSGRGPRMPAASEAPEECREQQPAHAWHREDAQGGAARTGRPGERSALLETRKGRCERGALHFGFELEQFAAPRDVARAIRAHGSPPRDARSSRSWPINRVNGGSRRSDRLSAIQKPSAAIRNTKKKHPSRMNRACDGSASATQSTSEKPESHRQIEAKIASRRSRVMRSFSCSS